MRSAAKLASSPSVRAPDPSATNDTPRQNAAIAQAGEM
jgi:hypothetical protein